MDKVRAVFSALLCLLVVAVAFTGAAYDNKVAGNPVHEYIVDQAVELYSNDEINQYHAVIRDGTTDEDERDHVYDRSGACTTINHFWDADKGLDDPSDSTAFCADGPNAWQKAQVYWGMALGEYASGDKFWGYHYLGHVAHLLADMTVPTHAHEDMHGPDWYDDDSYEEWMSMSNAQLSQSEKDWLGTMGPVEIPDGIDPLFYVFYTANQIGDFFPSDDYNGDTNDNFGGWMDGIYTDLGMYSITSPRTAKDLENNDDGNNNGDGDLGVIRNYTFLHAIRSVAALIKLFDETTKADSALTVVIERIKALDCHGWYIWPFGCTDEADFFVEIIINGFWFVNEGNQVVDHDDISPYWAFARHVGFTDPASVTIKVWDEDESPNPDDHSDINPAGGKRDLGLTIDLVNGAISGDLTGTTGVTLSSRGYEDERSQIWFRIIMPNIPPTANAGLDQTVNEGDLVTMSGSFTDPNTEDTHTIEWDFGDGVTASGTLTPSHTYGDNGVYTVTMTVTDNRGLAGSDTLTVTVNNVAPSAAIDSIETPLPDALPHLLLPTEAITFHGSFVDPGWLDTHVATWDFGDGTIRSGTLTEENVQPDATGTITADHAYADPGIYTVTLTVTDDDGGVGIVSIEIKVAAPEEFIRDLQDYLNNLPDEAFKNNPDQRKNALSNKLDVVLKLIDEGDYEAAINKIENDIGAKMDGDPNPQDWVIDSTVQDELMAVLETIVAWLETKL